MSALRHFAQLFSVTPSSLRAGLLGFGLAFAATDPSVAVVHKPAAPQAQAGLSGRMIAATATSDRAPVLRPHQPNSADFPA
jgi:hypothetical protein